jgi:hypothetical protein
MMANKRDKLEVPELERLFQICKQGPMLYKFFTAVSENVCNKLVFVRGRPFQPILMLASEAGAQPSDATCR